eukprot:6877313-Pyramimonas_sp.AAC.1
MPEPARMALATARIARTAMALRTARMATVAAVGRWLDAPSSSGSTVKRSRPTIAPVRAPFWFSGQKI